MNKYDLLEGQLMHHLKKLQQQEAQAHIDRKNGYLTEVDYQRKLQRLGGGIDALSLCLTVHDNPLSNFQSEQK